MTPSSTYVHFAPYVRRRLADFGVRPADLPDLCQEVFLVVHGKQDRLPEVDRLDLWLREICRRVAAGYRRRAGHRLEVLGCDLPEGSDLDVEADDEVELAAKVALLRRALNHLDDESRDLLALHHVGEMPLSQLAELVDHDRKTVRTRLARARRRMWRWMGGDDALEASVPLSPPVRITPPESPFMREQAVRSRATGCVASQLEVIRVSPEHCSGAIGNVVVSDWRGPNISPTMLESMMGRVPYTLATCGGEFAYLALMEPTMRPPSLDARQKIVDAIEVVGPYISCFAVVLLGANARINQPILEGMMLLVRPRFPLRFFASVTEAAEWLCATTAHGPAGPLAPAELTAAAEQLQLLEAGHAAATRRAGAHRTVS